MSSNHRLLFGCVLGLPLLAGGLLVLAEDNVFGAAVALVLNMAAVACAFAAISARITGSRTGFALSGLNRYSLSRLQLVAWTVLVVGLLLTVVEWNLLLHRPTEAQGLLGITVPPNVLVLLGIALGSGVVAPALISLRAATSGGTSDAELAAAKDRKQGLASQTGQASADTSVVRAGGRIVGNASPAGATWTDLFTGEDVAITGRVDISKVQQAIITLFLLCAYFAAAVASLDAKASISTLPDLGRGLVDLLAFSHAGYLAYKVVPKTSPEPPATQPN